MTFRRMVTAGDSYQAAPSTAPDIPYRFAICGGGQIVDRFQLSALTAPAAHGKEQIPIHSLVL